MDEIFYTIECKYEYLSREGVKWTNWFIVLSTHPDSDMRVLEEQMNRYKESDKRLKSKYKHEYRMVEYIEPEEVHTFQRMYKRKAKKNTTRGQKKSQE